MEYKFDKDGFQLYKNVLSDDIVEYIYNFLSSEMYFAINELKEITKNFTSGDLVQDIDYIFKNSDILGFNNTIKASATGLYPLRARLSPKLHKILESPKLLNILQSILKTQHIKMHMPPAARYVLPKNLHAMAPAHCDTLYNKYVDDFIVVWVPVTPITLGSNGSGGLAFFDYQADPDTLPDGDFHPYWLPEIKVDGYKQIHLDLNPGDVFVFNRHVLHKSMPNNSESPRISIDYRFFSGALTSSKHCYDLSTQEIIAPAINDKEVENVLS